LNKHDFLTPLINRNKNNNNNYNNHSALIISCNNIGKQIAKDFKNLNLKTTIATTKPRKIDEYANLANDVILIPQMEVSNDEIMCDAVDKNDIIILADTISIFSAHTFFRTCKRIQNAVKNSNKNKTVILISSVNVYAIRINGEVVNELSDIKNNFDDNNNKDWQINHIGISTLMRTGEKYLLELMNNNNDNNDNNKIRTVVLRTSSIIDNDIIAKIKKQDFSVKKYNNEIANSYMSVSLTDEISNCIKWIIDNNEVDGVFNLVSESFKRKYFYDKLFDIINKKKIDWNSQNKINKDYYFSMDENPLLPNSQRFNMKVDCDKIVDYGYKFKYKNKYRLFDAIKNYQL
jgi:NAD dependent epimerase/dehydratase family enzyme